MRLREVFPLDVWVSAGRAADAWEASYMRYLKSCVCVTCGAKHDGKRQWLTETECWPCAFGGVDIDAVHTKR